MESLSETAGVMMLSPVCWMLCFPVLSIAAAGWNTPTFPSCAKVNEIGDMKLVNNFELKRQEGLLADAQKDGKDKARREQVKKSESDIRHYPYIKSIEHTMLLKEPPAGGPPAGESSAGESSALGHVTTLLMSERGSASKIKALKINLPGASTVEDRSHDWTPVAVVNIGGHSLHARYCRRCGIRQNYGRCWGSNRYRGLQPVDEVCTGIL
jgi:hypothetical protein